MARASSWLQKLAVDWSYMTRLPVFLTRPGEAFLRSTANTRPRASATRVSSSGGTQSWPLTPNVVGVPSTTRRATMPLRHSEQ